MLPSATVVMRGLCLWYNSSNIEYIICNKPSKPFLKCQMAKDIPIPLFSIKKPIFCNKKPILHIVILFFYSIYSRQF